MNVCVFCGSRPGDSSLFEKATRDTARALTEQGLNLVYGGGSVGLMGVLADEVLASGGTVIGVIPDFMREKEVAHKGLSELIWVKSMHERKRIMAEKADFFVALPGGWGTLDELAEILTWNQLEIISKPVGLLNLKGYYDPLIAMFKTMAEHNFMSPQNLGLLRTHSRPRDLIEVLITLAKENVKRDRLTRT